MDYYSIWVHGQTLLLQTSELTGAFTKPNKDPSRTGRIITYVHVQHLSPDFILHINTKHGLNRLLEFTWGLLLERLTKVKLPTSFGINNLVVEFCCGYADNTIGYPAVSLNLAPCTAQPSYHASYS